MESPVSKVAILVGTHGRGTNMRALAEACARGDVPAPVALVVSPKDGTGAVEAARELGLRVEILPYKDPDYAARLLKALRDAGARWVCLAGYMRLLPLDVLEAFPDRVLNIHPALLPKFGGKGMFGRHVHEAVLAAGEPESGCTVHLVNELYDEGRILLQKRCPVEPGDTPETLAARVLALEHVAYAEALAGEVSRRGAVDPQGVESRIGDRESGTQRRGPAVHGPVFRWVYLPLLKLFAGFLLFLLGPLRVSGKRRFPRSGPVLILANHLADLDPVAVQVACPRPIHFMGKSELFAMPVLGAFLRLYKAFPVKRGEPDRGALKLAVVYLRAGEVVCVFPEGQLSEDGALQPLKPGVALIVRMSGAQVICLGLQGTQRALPYGAAIPRPAFRTLRARWGEPRTFTKADDVASIMAWAEAQLRELTT